MSKQSRKGHAVKRNLATKTEQSPLPSRWWRLLPWSALLGTLGSAATLLWWDGFKRPHLAAEFTMYSTSDSVAASLGGDTTVVVESHVDVTRNCRIGSLRWRIPRGVSGTDSLRASVQVVVRIENAGRGEAQNVLVGVPANFPGEVTSWASANVSTVTKKEVGNVMVVVERLAAHSRAAIEFTWRMSPAELASLQAHHFQMNWPFMSAAGVPETAVPHAPFPGPLMGLKDSLHGHLTSRTHSLRGLRKGVYSVIADVYEAAGVPSLSFTGTCGYDGPPRPGPIASALSADTMIYTVTDSLPHRTSK